MVDTLMVFILPAPKSYTYVVGLAGGTSKAMPGEVSLAHNGVLFLDELGEFSKATLEVLRQPLEDRKITISRAKYTVEYPCSFMFVASTNPCPCGYYGDPNHNCVCTPGQIARYFSKFSGPLMDRIDIQVNAQMTEKQIHQFAEPDVAGLNMLRMAMERLSLSARAYSRILKVARTIADLNDSEKVQSQHIAEAIGYRSLDRGDWAERGI